MMLTIKKSKESHTQNILPPINPQTKALFSQISWGSQSASETKTPWKASPFGFCCPCSSKVLIFTSCCSFHHQRHSVTTCSQICSGWSVLGRIGVHMRRHRPPTCIHPYPPSHSFQIFLFNRHKTIEVCLYIRGKRPRYSWNLHYLMSHY